MMKSDAPVQSEVLSAMPHGRAEEEVRPSARKREKETESTVL